MLQVGVQRHFIVSIVMPWPVITYMLFGLMDSDWNCSSLVTQIGEEVEENEEVEADNDNALSLL